MEEQRWPGSQRRRGRGGLTLVARTLYDRLVFPGVLRTLKRFEKCGSSSALGPPNLRSGREVFFYKRCPRNDETTRNPRLARVNDAVRESGDAGRFPGPGTGHPRILGALEGVRAAPREEPGQAALVLPRRPDHRQQPDGRPPRLGPHLQGRLSALLRHDRPRRCATRTASTARACGSRSRSRRSSS